MCGKKIHKTKAEALSHKRRIGDSTQMNVYFCAKCKGWHIGRSRSHWRWQQRIDQLLGKRRYENQGQA